MDRSVFDLCLKTAIVSFLVGAMAATGGWVLLTFHASPSKQTQIRRTQEARIFFYATMRALFEGTYNPDDGSISPEALASFGEYESRIGDKCYAQISDDSSGYHSGIVLFPSGDIFQVIIMRDAQQHLVLKKFAHQDWDGLWSDEIARTRRLESTGTWGQPRMAVR